MERTSGRSIASSPQERAHGEQRSRAIQEAPAAATGHHCALAVILRATSEREALLRMTLEQLGEAVLITDGETEPPGPTILYVNPAFCKMTGYSADELIGRSPRMLQGPEPGRDLLAALNSALEAGASLVGEAVNYRKDGSPYHVEWQITPVLDDQGRATHFISVQHDMSDRHRAQALLEYHAHFDLVTGLPNRYSFSDELEATIAAAAARDSRFALCFIDLDRFNRINDTLGHTAGDDVLAAVAQRLRHWLRPGDMLARMGGDEFTLIMKEIRDEAAATHIAESLLRSLDAPFVIDGKELFVSASIGLSVYPRDGADSGTLLKNADSAMYRAKARGRNNVCCFAPELVQAAHSRLELDNQLRRAIDIGQFVLYYQPQISLRSGGVVGVESLIRWMHPERGLLPPGQFIGAAEESHLMTRIATWVIEESCMQAARWQAEGRPPIRVAVNVSARQFEVHDIVQRVTVALRASGLDPQQLELELTESMLMSDPDGSALRIEQLRGMGVRVTVDDFGTGYSSLAYLQKFPVDALKIDRSFVWGLGNDPRPGTNGAALVGAIVDLAHSLGLSVVAEGVETMGQHALLQAIGCDEAQGFLYARPLPAGELWEAVEALGRS